MSNKITLFSHCDLDSIGAIICLSLLKKDFEYVQTKNPQDCSSKVKEFLESGEYVNYKEILFSDISVNEEVAEMLNEVYKEGINVELYDHHKTALWLNKYKWATVEEKLKFSFGDLRLTCGSELFYALYFFPKTKNANLSYEMLESLDYIIEGIRAYDTWDWFNEKRINKTISELAYKLNTLYYYYFAEDFCNMLVDFIKNADEDSLRLIPEEMQIVFEVLEKQKQSKIKQILKSVRYSEDYLNGRQYKVAYVIAYDYSSDLGSAILNQEEIEVDIAVIWNPLNGSVSLRSKKSDVDVSAIAKSITDISGGHTNASGFTPNLDIFSLAIDKLFEA